MNWIRNGLIQRAIAKESQRFFFQVSEVELRCKSYKRLKWRLTLFLIQRISKALPNVFTIQLRTVSTFWTYNPISLQHVSFWCPFWTTSLATHDFTIGVQLERVTTRAPHKVDVPNLVFDLKYTPIFEWYMVGNNVRTDTKKIGVEKRLDYVLKLCYSL